MATERWGIKTYDDSGYINLHSDYSSIVYYGEMSVSTPPVQPMYQGESYFDITAYKTTRYDMGWTIQFVLGNINTSFLLPFYRPVYSGQQIAVLDVVRKDSTTWIVNLLYQGTPDQIPRVFAFAPLNAIPRPPLSNRGLHVFDASGGLVFTDSKRPLRVDDVVTIKHPASIKTGDRGGCGNDSNCHINYTSDQVASYTGTFTNTSTKLYHIVPSAYGGLAYKNQGSGSNSCGFLDLGTREYAWVYQSWASFRGTVGHIYNTTEHRAEWLGDFAGGFHQYKEGDCGLSGILGAILGAIAVVFTLGAALPFVIGGALLGFAVAGVPAAPSLRAYDADRVFDTNNASNLIITDASYYNIDLSAVQLPLVYYGLIANIYTVPEGTTVTFSVSGYNIANGTYYWTINSNTNYYVDFQTNNLDFVSTSGFFTITNNIGSFTVTPLQDNNNEYSEIFTVSIRTGSISGPVVKTSSEIEILGKSGNAYRYTRQYEYPANVQYTFSPNKFMWIQQNVWNIYTGKFEFNLIIYYNDKYVGEYKNVPELTTSINIDGYTYLRGYDQNNWVWGVEHYSIFRY